MLHVEPVQPDWHVQVDGLVQRPLTHAGLQTGMLQRPCESLVHPAKHTHPKGMPPELPFTQPGLVIAVLHVALLQMKTSQDVRILMRTRSIPTSTCTCWERCMSPARRRWCRQACYRGCLSDNALNAARSVISQNAPE